MGMALHGWHRWHAGSRPGHEHAFAIWSVAFATLLLGALLLRPTGSARRDETMRTGELAGKSSVATKTDARDCARALTDAETQFAADPTPVKRLHVARCMWRLACSLRPDESEHCRALLDRADRLLDDPLLIGHLTPDDLRMKATINVLCAPPIDLPGAPVNGRRAPWYGARFPGVRKIS